MNKKKFLVEFDKSLKTYKSLNIPIPTVQVDTEEDDIDNNNDWYCDDCEQSFQEGENCHC
jgi:hypothetical protein